MPNYLKVSTVFNVFPPANLSSLCWFPALVPEFWEVFSVVLKFIFVPDTNETNVSAYKRNISTVYQTWIDKMNGF